MTRRSGRRLTALALVAALLLAGCGGAPTGREPSETLTPVPVPETDAPSATPGTTTPDRSTTPRSPDGRGPGLGPDGGVVDRFALVQAHIVRVTRASYTIRQVTTVRGENGSLRSQQTVTARVATGGDRFLLTDDVRGPGAARVRSPPGRFELWSDGDRFVSRFQPRDGPAEYARAGPDRYPQQRQYYSPPPDRGTLLATLSAFELGPAGPGPTATPTATPRPAPSRTAATGAPATTTPATLTGAGTGTDASTPRPVPVRNDTATPSVDGRDTRLVGRELVSPGALAAAGPGTAPRNASLRLTVDPRGRIRYLDLRYTATVEGERVRVHRRSNYEVGGVTVERPAWYGTALDATGDSTATASEEG